MLCHIKEMSPHPDHPSSSSQAMQQQSGDLFRLLVDAVDEYAIFALDPNGNILTWNNGARRLKGYKAEEVIGTHFSRFYTKADIERDHPAYELRRAEAEGKYEEEGWRIKKDGSTFWANVVITALKDKDGKLLGFGKVTRDLTQRMLAEKMLRESEERVRKANAELEERVEERTRELTEAKARAESAVKARDEFFSMASHELKTPLSALKMQAQMRKRNVENGQLKDFAPERLPKLTADDLRQVERLVFLVDNMLDISRLTSGNFRLSLEEFDITEMAQDVVRRMRPLLEKTGNACTVKPSPQPIVGIWDRHRLEQVLTNLLSNAGKYAPGTEVEVEARLEGSEVLFCVHDRGPGISSADRERILKPFERAKAPDEVSGLGLGLYISSQIVEAHGGTFEIDSEYGRGAIFRVRLPLRSQQN